LPAKGLGLTLPYSWLVAEKLKPGRFHRLFIFDCHCLAYQKLPIWASVYVNQLVRLTGLESFPILHAIIAFG
jgi:hypothetical protein